MGVCGTGLLLCKPLASISEHPRVYRAKYASDAESRMPGSPEYDTPTKRGPRSAAVDIKISIPNMTLTEQIGKGGYGAVYIGEHHILKNRVAVKVLNANLADPNWTARFQREAQALSRLSHPNIVKVYSFTIMESGQAAMVMELVEGRSLQDLIDNCGPLSAQRSVSIYKQLCDALGYAHELGIVHRDIKPGNIIITADDQIKLLDFGIAKLLDEQSGVDATKFGAQRLTSTGQFMGTPAFMSPEQCEGKPAEPASDIYSLACVLYFMLTGRNVFGGNTDAEVMLKHCKTTPKLKKLDVAPDLIRILAKSLKKDPNERYQNCESIQTDLSSAVLITKKRETFWTPRIWGIILAGTIPVVLFAGFLLVRHDSTELEKNKFASADGLKTFNNLFSSALKDLQDGKVDKAVGTLQKATKIELPANHKYLRWRAFDYLFRIAHDKAADSREYAKGMLDAVEDPSFLHARINSGQQLDWRIFAFLANAAANKDNHDLSKDMLSRAASLLERAPKGTNNFSTQNIFFLSLKADSLRAKGDFSQASVIDKQAYEFLESRPDQTNNVLKYIGDGLMSCVKYNAPPSAAEIHRNMLIKLMSAENEQFQSPVNLLHYAPRTFAGDADGIICFARQARLSKYVLSHRGDQEIEWTIVNAYNVALEFRNGYFINLVSQEDISYLENAIKNVLSQHPTVSQYDVLLNLIAGIARYKLQTSGETAAIKKTDQLLSYVNDPFWRLKAIALVDHFLSSVKNLKLSSSAAAELNSRYTKLLELTLNGSQQYVNKSYFYGTHLSIDATGKMLLALYAQGVNRQKRTEMFLRWYELAKNCPRVDPVLKLNALDRVFVCLSELHTADAKNRQLVERLSTEYLQLLEQCHSDDLLSISVYVPSYERMIYCLGLQLSEKRFGIGDKAFDLFQKRAFYKSAEVRGSCLFEWLVTVLYFPNKQLMSDEMLDTKAEMLLDYVHSLDEKDDWKYVSESVKAAVLLYKTRSQHAKSVAFASKVLTLANKCPAKTLTELKKNLDLAKGP